MWNTIEAAFLSKGLVRGGVLLLEARDAIALIEEARKQRIPILGVDAFVVSEQATQPLSAHTLDLSGATGTGPIDTWAEAANFIQARADDGFMFEVVV